MRIAVSSNFSRKTFEFPEKLFLEDPELRVDLDISYLSHKEKYEEAVRRAAIVMKKIRQLQSKGGKELIE